MLIFKKISGDKNVLESHRRKSKTLSTIVDQKSIETVFLIAICRQCGDKRQSKTLFLAIFYLCFSIALAFSIAAYPVWERNSSQLTKCYVIQYQIFGQILHQLHHALSEITFKYFSRMY